MEKKLYDACVKGDVKELEALMREDELTLARVSISSCFNQTPLHLASMLGHFEFAKSLLFYKSDFASRLDSQDRSPLHVASANGYANIVKLLLEYDVTFLYITKTETKDFYLAFTASLSVTFLYISGAKLKRRIFIWLIRAAMWMTLTSMTVAYTCAVQATSGGYEQSHTIYALFIAQYVWTGLILLSFLVLVYRSARYVVRTKRATRKKDIREATTFFRTPNTDIV